MPFALLGAAAGLFGAYNSYKSGKEAKKAGKAQAAANIKLGKEMAAQYIGVGKYNAKIIALNTKIEQDAITDQGNRLAKHQRELRAQQRMSVRSRNGVIAGGDLLALINSAADMQTDLLQLGRAYQLAGLNGTVRADQILYEADMNAQAAIAQGEANAAMSRAHGSQAYGAGITSAMNQAYNAFTTLGNIF